MNEIYYVVTSFSNGVREYYSNLGKVTRYFPNAHLFDEKEVPSFILGTLAEDPFMSADWEIRQVKVCME